MPSNHVFYLLETAVLLVLFGTIMWGVNTGNDQLVTIGIGGIIVLEIHDVKTRLREVSDAQ